MGLFKKKTKSRKKPAVPTNSKLFATLRGIDEQEILKARKMAGFDTIIRVEPKATKVELIDLKK